MKDLFLLFRLTFKQKKLLFLSFGSSIFVAIFTYLFVDMVQPIMDRLFLNTPVPAVPGKARLMDSVLGFLHVSEADITRTLPIIMVVVIFGKGLFTFLASFFMKSVGHRVVKDMRDDLYEHVIYQSTSYFDRVPTGDLMSRLTNDVEKVKEALSGSLGDSIEEVFILVALLIGIFIRDARLAVVSFVVAPMAAIPLAVFSRMLKKKSMTAQIKMGQIYGLLHETITGNKIVKAFTTERFEIKKFLNATAGYLRTSIKLAWIGSLSSPFMEFLGGAVAAFILWVGTKRIAEGAISPGDFGAFLTAIFMMYMPIKRLSRANNVIQQAVASLSRIQEVLDQAPQIKDKPGANPLPLILEGRIRFESVSFGYNESRPVLTGIDFEVKPTETVAIVGLSGAGKTTIINLLTRFYDPTSGRILVDGIDIQDVTLASLRSRIGLVTQEIILFNETIKDNIAYGLDAVPLERIVAAAKAAKAHGFIEQLPEGYDTKIGERGGLLSSGQRQRLAIARALLKDPPILVLDEATSALDAESEHLIQEALANLRQGRTTVIIAHRLSTVRSADRIMVIEAGRIAEMGTHEELCRCDGLYRKLYELQFPEDEEISH
ncbi:MAG: ABC transporter ATP-binding protein [Candidatus Aminicenantales bacterium]